MARYLLRLGGRVLATALFTGALLFGFVAPSAAGDFVLWNGVFTADGECKVTAIDQSTNGTGRLPPINVTVGETSCAQLMGAIQMAGETTTPDPLVCEQSTQSHIITPPPPGKDPLFDKLFRGPPEFLEEELKGRVFRVAVTGEARCELKETTTPQ